MLRSCEYRDDEFTLPELQNSHPNCDNFQEANSKAFIDTSMLTIETAQSENEQTFEPNNLVNSLPNETSFSLSSLVNESPCFETSITKDNIFDDQVEILSKQVSNSNEIFKNCLGQKRKIDSVSETVSPNPVQTHLNKRKRSFVVRKNQIDEDDVFEDDDPDDLEKIPSDENDFELISKSSKKEENDEQLNQSLSSSDVFQTNSDQIKIKRPKALPEKATKIMKEWYEKNLHNPYPTDDERRTMAEQGEINENQVKAWFANKRNRSCNTKNKQKQKSFPFEEIKKITPEIPQIVNIEDKTLKPIIKPKVLAKKSETPKNFDHQNKFKFNSTNYPTYSQYPTNLDETKNPMNPRFLCKQPQNNIPYYPYIPKPEPKFVDLNNNYFNPYLNQANNYEYCSNPRFMYTSPVAHNESQFIHHQNFINPSIPNGLQFYDNLPPPLNYTQSCAHNFYSDPSLIECTQCPTCIPELAQNEIHNISSNNPTPLNANQQCDTPPPIKPTFRSDELKSEKNQSICRNQQAKYMQNENQKRNNFYNYQCQNNNPGLSYPEYIPIQSNNSNYIKSSLISDAFNTEPVTSLLDSLNQVQNSLSFPPSQGFIYPPNDYNGSTVTINNINYTNPNGSLINSISSILTKPTSTASPMETQNDMFLNNGVDNFGNMLNHLALNNLINNQNSVFNKRSKCNIINNKISHFSNEHDSRFTDSKAKEWCLKSHPKLANTLLNSYNYYPNSLMGNMQQNGSGFGSVNDAKKSQN
ncbi:unnamed protein product [Brachionus calyciflorus]|uniref:Homeobox domain-containing protein n=1 Tax=Brachionus calyciflorus TaxID=104777 RepID=A0A813SRL5_9BILA|nr:unnamed protein product [Brachionus calyciflorus]